MEPLHCPSCGYNLTGLPENRCPECGRQFEVGAVARLQISRRRTAGWARVLLPFVVFVVGAFVVMCVLAVQGRSLSTERSSIISWFVWLSIVSVDAIFNVWFVTRASVAHYLQSEENQGRCSPRETVMFLLAILAAHLFLLIAVILGGLATGLIRDPLIVSPPFIKLS